MEGRSFAGRHAGSIAVLLTIAVLTGLQMPAAKAVFQRYFGHAAPDHSIAWCTDLPSALEEARREGKPLLVQFTATWCSPCQLMKHEVWPSQEIGDLTAESFIPVMIDIDTDTITAVEYNIFAVPSVLILTPDGEVVKRAGYLSRRGMIAFLTESAEEAAERAQAAKGSVFPEQELLPGHG
jgi:thiol:disulfide interchange protein